MLPAEDEVWRRAASLLLRNLMSSESKYFGGTLKFATSRLHFFLNAFHTLLQWPIHAIPVYFGIYCERLVWLLCICSCGFCINARGTQPNQMPRIQMGSFLEYFTCISHIHPLKSDFGEGRHRSDLLHGHWLQVTTLIEMMLMKVLIDVFRSSTVKNASQLW